MQNGGFFEALHKNGKLERTDCYYMKNEETKETVVVDSNKFLVPLYLSGEESENRSYTGKIISHFTTIDSLISIFESKHFYAKSVMEYRSQKTAVPNGGAIDGCIFSASFTSGLNMDDKMWSAKKGCNSCIQLIFSKSVDDLIDKRELFGLKSEPDGEPIELFAHLNCAAHPKRTKEVFVSTRFSLQSYETKETLEKMRQLRCSGEGLSVKDETYHILGQTGTHELDKWFYQNEVKLLATLRASKPVEIKRCKWLVIPIRFDGLSKIVITLKNEVSAKKENELRRILDEQIGDLCKIEFQRF